MDLIVAEKRSVAQAIARYLGGSYKSGRLYGVPFYSFTYLGREAAALGLSGHIMDYDFTARENVWTWIPPEELFRATPVLVFRPETANYVKALRSLAKKAERVYLALDADVEGEAIAYEAALVVKLVNRRAEIYRVRFNAVTYRDVRSAFQKPTKLDLRQVEKVFTRMQIDLTLGAVFTRFLTLTVRNSLERGRFLSYGPCQTPVLGIVVTRELQRRNFKPEKYYVIKALVEIGGHAVEMASTERFKTRREAETAAASVKRGVVKTAVYRQHAVQPPEPLETVELERRASRWLGISSKKALDTAEELYRAGYISYPRTETTIYPSTLDLREVLKELAGGEHGPYAEELLKRGFKPTRGDSDDGAHPPIYPTRGATQGEIYKVFGKLGRQAWAIYDLVVRHFLATLSPPALVEKQRIVATFGGVELEAEGQRTIEEGYWRIYPWERQRDKPLPRVEAGEAAKAIRVEVVERETEPPPQMSESELLALMKKYGIGTDATMQDHIHTNVKRGYMRLQRGKCIPTKLGEALATALFQYAPELIEPTVRAKMEKALQDVVRGAAAPTRLIQEIKDEFERYYKALKERRQDLKTTLETALKSMSEDGSGGG
ncbi:DNA topoisomerase [Pyrobaculum neutrophilum]|uniref:DNA topoisomerase n=1 Tax=Pyrobaculum neutrophilum (strain DSM 2338 / JCM 9278 / NBRC 100436 / V24Sta) TaxID=444157 RepID=B1YAK4_PYRNV|nr:type IA DNA topoisomerase [Pyrobaculum neutrophilum]ACB40653.1 DNA topoisomerase type IA central domain protein [Pyrobaculum neutrophilum V24Sta]